MGGAIFFLYSDVSIALVVLALYIYESINKEREVTKMAQFNKGHPGYRSPKQCAKGAYIVAYTTKRKNGKRHVYARFNSETQAIHCMAIQDRRLPKYTWHVYSGQWEVIR